MSGLIAHEKVFGGGGMEGRGSCSFGSTPNTTALPLPPRM